MSQKEHYPSVASDVESVATDVESVATDGESVATYVEFVTTNEESVATDVESVATDMESNGIHQTNLSGGFICSNSFSICCTINNSININKKEITYAPTTSSTTKKQHPLCQNHQQHHKFQQSQPHQQHQ
ncbi:hypothetical protein FXO38_20922 [Capsicum annuum]|uniref:Uncharacterized protein n=1 Tax=Capsicum annuum TaxID=4072 RepID=A0A2G2YU60_CAPAN|nr:hypothetical protein FXO37_28098 [Capsicum annuum]KAF3642798.1 hypothetical protein FXO38_20922 [Capsicum annuum]PHT73317.1 hypothetical protein T459_24102 [Capsicum annuum]